MQSAILEDSDYIAVPLYVGAQQIVGKMSVTLACCQLQMLEHRQPVSTLRSLQTDELDMCAGCRGGGSGVMARIS